MRLEDICTVFTDGDWIESKDQSESGIRLVQTGNIGEGTYLEKEARAKYISEGTFDKLKCTEIFSGDILVSRLPEPVGRACIVPEKAERMITAVDCTICRPNESLINKEICVILCVRKPIIHACLVMLRALQEKEFPERILEMLNCKFLLKKNRRLWWNN